MKEENKIKFLGKTYDLNALKGGITKKDLEKNLSCQKEKLIHCWNHMALKVILGI